MARCGVHIHVEADDALTAHQLVRHLRHHLEGVITHVQCRLGIIAIDGQIDGDGLGRLSAGEDTNELTLLYKLPDADWDPYNDHRLTHRVWEFAYSSEVEERVLGMGSGKWVRARLRPPGAQLMMGTWPGESPRKTTGRRVLAQW